jgi:folate-binding protein YgfZ
MTDATPSPLPAPAEAEDAPPLQFPVPLDPAARAAHAALATGAAWWPAPVAWCAVQGPQAGAALNGLVTNEVTALAEGTGQRAATLTPKGKVITDLLLLREGPERLLVATPPAGMDAWLGILRKYVNPRLARATDERGALEAVVVAGAGASALLAPCTALGTAAALDALPPWQQVVGTVGEGVVRVVAHPAWDGVPGFLLVTDAASMGEVQGWLTAQGAHAAPPAVGELLRVSAGVPALGRDMDEGTLVQEANLDGLGAVSFTKGCYTGQETVARVHFRGHVNRHLRRLRPLDGASAVPAGAWLVDAEGKRVGAVTSAAWHPARGPVALGMVRRELAPGSTVRAHWGGGPEGAPADGVPLVVEAVAAEGNPPAA